MWTTVYDLRGNPVMKFNRMGDKYKYQYYNSKKNGFDDTIFEEEKEKFQTNLGNMITLKKATLQAPDKEVADAQKETFDSRYKANRRLGKYDETIEKGGLSGANTSQIMAADDTRNLIKKNQMESSEDIEKSALERYNSKKENEDRTEKAYNRKKETIEELSKLYKQQDNSKSSKVSDKINELHTELEMETEDTSDYEDELQRKKSFEPKEYVSKRDPNWKEMTTSRKYWDEISAKRTKDDRELAEQLARRKELADYYGGDDDIMDDEKYDKAMRLQNEESEDYDNGKIQGSNIADKMRVKKKYPNLTTDQIRKDKEAANERYIPKRPASANYETPISISRYISK